MPSIVPKPLRDALGEEATDALVDFLNRTQYAGRKTMENIASEKLERRLVEETSKIWIAIADLRVEMKAETNKLWVAFAELRAEMHAGFMGMQEQLGQVYKEIAKLYEGQTKLHAAITDIHKSIASQTRWTLAGMLGIGGILMALAKFLW